MTETRNRPAIRLALNHYFSQMRQNWVLTLLAIVLPAIGTTLVFYVPPLIVAKILVRFSNGGATLGALSPYIFTFAGLWALGEIFWRFGLHYLIKAEIMAMERLYNRAIELLLKKDLAFFNDNFAGSLTKKVVGYSKNYEGFIDTLTFQVFNNLIPLAFVCVILWHFSPLLVWGLLGMMSLTIAVVFPLVNRRQKLVDIREAASNVVSGHVADLIGNIPAVRAFSREDYELKKHQANVHDFLKKAKRSYNYQNLRVDVATSPLYVLTNTLGLVLALSLGKGSAINTGAIFLAFNYYTTFTRIVWEFNRIYRNLETAVTEAAQFTDLLLDEPVVTDPIKPEKLKLRDSSVVFKNVLFRYEKADSSHLFENYNLEIKSGEKVGLVGRSGGGKTTITKLILRFMNVDGGEILIGNQNIAHLKQADLRSAITYVPQEPLLFHRSLMDNIRYGNLNASNADVIKAAKLAHADEFIQKLPNAYETLVGERGVKLSGGQRQRIAIARAIIKDAPLVILDEATSALDSESEALIQDALWKLMEDRTAIVIAHRLSTIQKMDRIIVLDEGEIIEQGTHKELLELGGVYAELWKHQSGGFLDE